MPSKKDEKTEEIGLKVNENKRGDSYRYGVYGENVSDSDNRQKGRSDSQKRSDEKGKNIKRNHDEEDKNKELINGEISEEAADLVYNKEPRKKQLKEQEEQKGAAAKKLAEQKISNGKQEALNKEVLDTVDVMLDNMREACMYLKGKDLENAHKFVREMEIFRDGISSGRIIINKEQTNDFMDFGKYNKVVDEASAKDYIDFAFTRVLPFIAGVAMVAGVALGAVSPLSGIGKANSLFKANGINKLSDLGDSLLR